MPRNQQIAKLSAAKPQGRASKGRPVTFAAIEAWLQWMDRGIPQGKAKIDPRLLAIDPFLANIIKGIRGYGQEASIDVQRAVLEATRAVLASAPAPGIELRLAHIACDWMVRCALPRWFDRLPDWAGIVASPDRLADLTSLQWTDSVVRAIAALTPMWIALEHVGRDRGTGDERAAVFAAYHAAGEAMFVLSNLLPLEFKSGPAKATPAWLSHMSMRVIRNSKFEADPHILETVSALVAVLTAIKPGDSQRSVADRCVWPGSIAEEQKKQAG